MRKNYFISLVIICFALVATQIKAQDSTTTKVKTLWGGSASVSYSVFTGNISDNIKNPISLPITFDMIHKNLIVQLYLDGGFSKIKNTMSYDDGSSWNEGDNAWHDFLGLNVGYSVYNSTKLRITPQVGYGLVMISKKWWAVSDIAKHEPEIYNLNLSLCFDIKLKTGENKFSPYSGIRVTLGTYINTADASPYPELYNGDVFYFSVGVPVLDNWANIKSKKDKKK